TPSRAKLESKGVESVKSRITTLSQHLDMSIDDFKAHVKATLCDGEMVLNDAALPSFPLRERLSQESRKALSRKLLLKCFSL
ncbi:MAG: hypothetical protein II021_05050, partial [Oscillospiraceae bacterium]|nr:hypothetical protein [Oscillospiraceae bacterium]